MIAMKKHTKLFAGVVALVLVIPGVATARDVEVDNVGSSTVVDVGLKRQVEQSSVVVVNADGTTVEVPCSLEEDIISCTDGDVGMVGIINFDDEPGSGIKSASGTNKDVRIEVTGSGLVVTKWQTRARQYRADGCIDHDAFFWARPYGGWLSTVASVLYNGPCVTVPPYPVSSIDWWTTGYGPTGIYANQTQLCNSWSPTSKLAGLPCITVHD